MNIAMTCETIIFMSDNTQNRLKSELGKISLSVMYLGYAPNLNSSRCVAFSNTRAVAIMKCMCECE